MSTTHHTKIWAHLLDLQRAGGDVDSLSRSLGSARVDLNPHQVGAAVFALQALRLGGGRGALLADEVGLGKTIEAGLLLAQCWAEGKRRLLVVVPAMLRKQWQAELAEKFGLQADIVEGGQLNAHQERGSARLWICSYQFAAKQAAVLARLPWDLAVVDEAHRLRGANRGGLIAGAIAGLLHDTPRVLLTATPLQNNLLELHALAQLLDPHLFGDAESFKQQFVRTDREHVRNALLRQRLEHVCVRTLRRQVQEYVRFTRRRAHTQEFVPTDDEHRLYEDVSEWLRQPDSVALPQGQRALLTMVLRKLLASSTFAIASALRKILARVADENGIDPAVYLADDFETAPGLAETMGEAEPAPPRPANAEREAARKELALLASFADRADAIASNSKGEALVLALKTALGESVARGAANKAVVFTESRKTQGYLKRLLREAGYSVVAISGVNGDHESSAIYRAWCDRHRGDGTVSGVRSADVRASLVEEFRDRATVLVATEAAAEGVNLQFCSLVVNYDLPWNPQRVEQRIGRCHRYGQKHDVVVVNFLNRKNAADQRVLELLTDKFLLFEGVFGCSDEILGAVSKGFDLEARILHIYQSCRTEAEIQSEFQALRDALRPVIDDRMAETREQILSHFDEEVQERLRVHRDAAVAALDQRQRWLWRLLRFEHAGSAQFDDDEPAFAFSSGPHAGRYHLDWRAAEATGVRFCNDQHALAATAIVHARDRHLGLREVEFQVPTGGGAGRWQPWLGQTGWLCVQRLTLPGAGMDELLVHTAVSDDGEVMAGELAERLWTLDGAVGGHVGDDGAPDLANAAETAVAEATRKLRLERGKLLDQEADKLTRWAEDEKLALRLEIERLDEAIAALQRQVRQVQTLDEKLALRRQERELDRERTNKRRALYDQQDRVDAERDRLLDGLEAALQAQVGVREVLRARWRVVG